MTNNTAKTITIATLGLCGAIATLPVAGPAVCTGIMAKAVWGVIGFTSLGVLVSKDGDKNE